MRFCLLAFMMQFFLLAKAQDELAFRRQSHLGKGMNLTWAEQYWRGHVQVQQTDYFETKALYLKKAELPKMKALGINTLRLPVCFDRWENRVKPYSIDSVSYFSAVDSMIRWTAALDMNIVICYQHGFLQPGNKQYDDTTRLYSLWEQIARHFQHTDPEQVYFSIFNEPHDIADAEWYEVANRLVSIIRRYLPRHTLIAGGTEYNSLRALLRMKPLQDHNIIYAVHYYEPLIFTHQGAHWMNKEYQTIHVSFGDPTAVLPDAADAKENGWNDYNKQLFNQWKDSNRVLRDVRNLIQWSRMHHVPVYIEEFGSYRAADADQRARHMRYLRSAFEKYNIPYAWCEWDGNFSFFVDNKIPLIYQEAWGLHPAEKAPPFWKIQYLPNNDVEVQLLFEQPVNGRIALVTVERKKLKDILLKNKQTITIKGANLPSTEIKISVWDEQNRLRGTYTWDRRPASIR